MPVCPAFQENPTTTTSQPSSQRFKPELLAPGGSLEKCRIAFLYGADAVYVGGKQHSLRAYARNLNDEELAALCVFAHGIGKKVYVAVNTFAREQDIHNLPPYLQYLEDMGVDGLIVSDPGVLLLARRWASSVPIHLSTQANTTNSLSTAFWHHQGARRINLARELSFSEIQNIRKAVPAELEVFVHGAMCVSYSGRCLLSAFLNRRDANQGYCTQPCRWSYRLVEEKRPGQFFPLFEDQHGSYIFNSKDLCLMEEMGRLMAAGIDAFKIEGRMKGALYLASVTRAYRGAVDRYWHCPSEFAMASQWADDLNHVSHRPYTKGLMFPSDREIQQETSPSAAYVQTHSLAGLVRNPFAHGRELMDMGGWGTENWTCVEVRSRLVSGNTLEFLRPDGSSDSHVIRHMESLAGIPLSAAHPNSWIRLPLSFPTFPLQVIRISKTV